MSEIINPAEIEGGQLRDISVYTFQCEMTRMERTNHRMFILLILMLFALLGTNAGWLYYESQWETVEETTIRQTVDTGDGNANVTGIGDIYGQSNPDGNN